DTTTTKAKLNAMRLLGVPYSDDEVNTGNQRLWQQAEAIAADLQEQGVAVRPDHEIVALIAYLQRLGTDIKNTGASASQPATNHKRRNPTVIFKQMTESSGNEWYLIVSL